MNARRPSIHYRILRVAVFVLVNIILLKWLMVLNP